MVQDCVHTFILREEDRSRCFSLGDSGASSSCFCSWSSMSFESSLAMASLTAWGHSVLNCCCLGRGPEETPYMRASAACKDASIWTAGRLGI